MQSMKTRRYRGGAKLSLLVFIAAVFTGCAGFPTEKGYQQVLDRWIGNSGERLVAIWGLPTQEHTSPDGSKIFEFTQTRTYTMSGGTKTTQVLVDDRYVNGKYRGHYVDVAIPQPDETRRTWCNTRFYISDADIIQRYEFAGPDCTAYEEKDGSTTVASSAKQRQDATKLCASLDIDNSNAGNANLQLCPPQP
jgi:hypothetical protein